MPLEACVEDARRDGHHEDDSGGEDGYDLDGGDAAAGSGELLELQVGVLLDGASLGEAYLLRAPGLGVEGKVVI